MHRSRVAVSAKAWTALKRLLNTKLAAFGLAASVFFAITTFERQAQAAGINCTVTVVWYDQAPASNGSADPGRLIVFCQEDSTNTGYFAHVNEPSCSTANKSLDTLRVWASMATAFQLANRKVFLEFNPSGSGCGVRTITSIRTG